MAKKKTLYVCAECGYESPRWLGQCPECKNWNTLTQFDTGIEAALDAQETLRKIKVKDAKDYQVQRFSTGFAELDRTLGGGIVESEVILLSGEPGIGKSTLLLQLAANIAASGKKVAYISAEESAEQVALRARRVLEKDVRNLEIISGFEVDTLIDHLHKEKIEFAVLDSIQTIYDNSVRGLPGGLSQIKSVSSKLVKYAKKNKLAMFLVGQVTKTGDVAGPKLIEHLVDVVLYFEGDENKDLRLLRSLKNRYGSINEVGIFAMTEKGMVEVHDPTGYLTSTDQKPKVGVCLAAVVEGNRVIIMEVQALTLPTPFSLPKRVAEGITKSKLELLAAIISKYSRVNLSDKDIYINIAGGIKVKDPAIDLPIALAIISSSLEKPLPAFAAFGELSLTGYIRSGVRTDSRAKEIKRLKLKNFYKLFPQVKNISQIKPLLK